MSDTRYRAILTALGAFLLVLICLSARGFTLRNVVTLANIRPGQLGEAAALLPFIDANRLSTWIPGVTVGVPGGISNRTTIYTNLSTSATDVEIQAAIVAAPSGSVVQLTNGTYTLNGDIGFGFKKNVTLRGTGTNTILSASAAIGQFIMVGGDYNWPSAKSITAGWSTGSSNITVDSASSLVVGMLARVDQLAVAGLSWDRTGDANSREINQMVRIVAINGNDLTIWPPIYYANGGTPQLHYVLEGGQAEFCGVEDLVLEVNGQSVSYGVVFEQTYGCWIKNVRMTNINNYNILFWRSLFGEIASCTMIDSPDHGPNHTGILIGPTSDKASATGVLAYDNTIHRIFPGVEVNSSSGNVIAYNFVNDAFYDGFGQGVGIDVNHLGHCMFNLVEGNVVNTIQNDGYFGSASHNTYFRNWAHGFVTDGLGGQSSSYNSAPLKLNHYSLSESAVGNVFGHSNITPATYLASTNAYSYSHAVIAQLGYPNMGANNYTGTFDADGDAQTIGEDQRRDLRVATNTILHRNFDTYNGGFVTDVTRSNDLPASLYLTVKPSWMKHAFPLVNPSNGLAGLFFTNLNAGYRFYYGTDLP